MNQVFELVGNLVPPKVAHDLMCLLVEGASENDEKADSLLWYFIIDTPIPSTFSKTMKLLVIMFVVCIMLKSPPSSQFFVIIQFQNPYYFTLETLCKWSLICMCLRSPNYHMFSYRYRVGMVLCIFVYA
jgi:hypothetical protein